MTGRGREAERERDSERKSVWRIMTAESRKTRSKNVNSPKKAAKIKSQHQQKWNPNPKFCAYLFPSSSPPPSILSSVNGPQRVKNANPKSKLSAVALHVATWQPPSPRPRPAPFPRTHIRHAYMSDGRWRRVAQKKGKTKNATQEWNLKTYVPA